jgi:hypothetical protein
MCLTDIAFQNLRRRKMRSALLVTLKIRKPWLL